MLKRVLWLMPSVILPAVITAVLYAGISYARPLEETKGVIINEWSQGNGASREWVELLVMSQTVDLRGWSVSDDTADDLFFSDDLLWSNVPAGSLIVIYNGEDKDIVLPDDDQSFNDFLVVLPHTHTNLFEGSWPDFSNTNADDNPQLRNEVGELIHDFGLAPGYDLHPSTGEAAAYYGMSELDVGQGQHWKFFTAVLASPGRGNSDNNQGWIESLRDMSLTTADLVVQKSAPAAVTAGQSLVYTITVQNAGFVTATAVVLTDTLPTGLTYVEDSSGVSHNISGQEIVWSLNDLPASETYTFYLTTTTGYEQMGTMTNQVEIASATAESTLSNNSDFAETIVQPDGDAVVLIDAVLYQGQAKYDGQGDESVLLRNVSLVAADISGWQLNDGGSSFATLPADTILEAGESIWVAADAQAFYGQFGHWPDYAIEITGSVKLLEGKWPGYADTGDEVILYDHTHEIADVLIYETGNVNQLGWQGAAVEPYKINNTTAVRGQILYRQRHQESGLPIADTNSAADWAQDETDIINGRKIRYPGWRLDDYFATTTLNETAVMTVGVAPDNAYETIVQALNGAQQTIQIELHTFENLALGDALVAAAQRGVEVTVLLEGGPPGGIDDQQRYICQQIDLAGGACWFMINDDTVDIYDRYTYIHAKFAIIDGRQALVSSENFSPNSLPYDDKNDGTWGRRGVVFVTNATTVVEYLEALFAADFDPAVYRDLYQFDAVHPTYGSPPTNFAPVTNTGGITYTTRYFEPAVFNGTFSFEMVQSPENSLRTADGLLGLLAQAGAGDTVLVQQLTERPYWGDDLLTDPNPRVEAYLAAARRGATVKILLDSFFDDPSNPLSNSATCGLLKSYAQHEKLALQCSVGNPAGMGIHNKMVLAHINGQGYAHLGSINGTEQSHKGNRELAVQIASNELYTFLADMFYADWPYQIFLPFIGRDLQPRSNHLLISEVLYDPTGSDGSEFIELVNPTPATIDLTDYTIGDAWQKEEFADVRQFPEGAQIGVNETIVIAQQATRFKEQFGFNPDFEILETDPNVLNLIDDLGWGDAATFLQLGNGGDVVVLRNLAEEIVDVISYGDKLIAGVPMCTAVASGHSLRRNPYWQDSNDCQRDFEDWPLPDPGYLP